MFPRADSVGSITPTAGVDIYRETHNRAVRIVHSTIIHGDRP